jgi:hypothetical protein
LKIDFTKTLEVLRREKEKLERAIAALEELQAEGEIRAPLLSRRGRKSMTAEERQEISVRMKKYWAGRREQ